MGIPSIVYGAFGFALMLFFGMNASLLAGIITVALLISPIMVRTFDEVLSTIPKGLHEASLAMDQPGQKLLQGNVQAGVFRIITAVLLSFGRGIGMQHRYYLQPDILIMCRLTSMNPQQLYLWPFFFNWVLRFRKSGSGLLHRQLS